MLALLIPYCFYLLGQVYLAKHEIKHCKKEYEILSKKYQKLERKIKKYEQSSRNTNG
jgi:hypothetical protein